MSRNFVHPPTLSRALMTSKMPPVTVPRKVLQERAKVCYLCKWILEDLEKNGKATAYPLDWERNGLFPVDGKRYHLQRGHP